MSTKRQQRIALIRTAGYENDYRTALRIYTESRNIGRNTFDQAWWEGQNLRNRHKAEGIYPQ